MVAHEVVIDTCVVLPKLLDEPTLKYSERQVAMTLASCSHRVWKTISVEKTGITSSVLSAELSKSPEALKPTNCQSQSPNSSNSSDGSNSTTIVIIVIG